MKIHLHPGRHRRPDWSGQRLGGDYAGYENDAAQWRRAKVKGLELTIANSLLPAWFWNGWARLPI